MISEAPSIGASLRCQISTGPRLVAPIASITFQKPPSQCIPTCATSCRAVQPAVRGDREGAAGHAVPVAPASAPDPGRRLRGVLPRGAVADQKGATDSDAMPDQAAATCLASMASA